MIQGFWPPRTSPGHVPSVRRHLWDDEYAFGGDRDSFVVGEVAHREGLCAVDAIDARVRAQRTQRRSPHITQGESAGIGRTPRLVGGSAENVVENQCAHTPVHVTRWSLVSSTKSDLSPHQTVEL